MHLHRIIPLILSTTALAATLKSTRDASTRLNSRIEDGGDLVEVLLHLRPENRDNLERALYETSNPHHKNYHRFLNKEEATALLKPSVKARDSIKTWLVGEGVPESHIEDHNLAIRAYVPGKLSQHLKGWALATNGDHHARDVGEHAIIPRQIRDAISVTQIRTTGDSPSRRNSEPSHTRLANFKRGTFQDDRSVRRENSNDREVDLEKCKEVLTPACIRKIYNMPTTPAKPHPKTRFSVPGFNEQTAQHSELEEFLKRFDPTSIGANFSDASANGGKNPQGEYPSGEANLDIQYAVSMSFNTSVQFLSVGGEFRDFIPDLDIPDPTEEYVEPYLELATYLLDLPDDKLPQVISISYGINEQVIPEAYARQTCDIFGQLGTRGVSIISAGGNTGPGISCQANDGTNSTRFLPFFPATCPYVTAVGATEGNSPEVATNFSSGGFSNYFGRPDYQKDAVKKYLDVHGDEWKEYYKATGRGSPDIAALGWGYQILNHGEVETTGGTSAATPVFASMISLINNDRFHKGKPAMGFLNPWLYSIQDLAFTDITEGKSIGCEGESRWGAPAPEIPGAGWSAVEGWDPITGIGTPLFDRLKQLACK